MSHSACARNCAKHFTWISTITIGGKHFNNFLFIEEEIKHRIQIVLILIIVRVNTLIQFQLQWVCIYSRRQCMSRPEKTHTLTIEIPKEIWNRMSVWNIYILKVRMSRMTGLRYEFEEIEGNKKNTSWFCP